MVKLTMLYKKVQVKIGYVSSEEKIENLYLLYGDEPNAFIDLDYDGCYYPGDNPSMAVYKYVELKEEELKGLTREQIKDNEKYKDINISDYMKFSKTTGEFTGLK